MYMKSPEFEELTERDAELIDNLFRIICFMIPCRTATANFSAHTVGSAL